MDSLSVARFLDEGVRLSNPKVVRKTGGRMLARRFWTGAPTARRSGAYSRYYMEQDTSRPDDACVNCPPYLI